MNDLKLSIIIPQYNNAVYINKCIESIDNQYLPSESYEIIIVNDGSTDNSCDVVNKYVNSHSNVTLLSQINQGPGIARNLGLSVAKGKYILFMDADDYLSVNVLNDILEVAEHKKLDLLLYKYQEVYEDGKKVVPFDYDVQYLNKVMSGRMAISVLKFYHSVWSGIFSRHSIESQKVYFENQVWGEDVWFMVRFLNQAERVMAVDSICYNYVKYNMTSLTNRKNINYNHLIKVAQSRVDVSVKMKRLADNMPIREWEDSRCADVLTNGAYVFTYYAIYKILQSRMPKTIFESQIRQLSDVGLYPIKQYEYKWKSKKDELIRLLINYWSILKLLNFLKLA